MKHSTLIIFFLLGAISWASAQSETCSAFFTFQKGVEIEYGYFDKKGKMDSRNINSISAVDETDDGTVTAQVDTKMYDKKDELVTEGTYQISCKDNKLMIDASGMLNPAMMEGMGQMEVDVTGDEMVLPSKLSVGQELPDARTVIKAGTGQMTIMTVTVEVTDRKVEAKETVETQAGKFDCFKITHTVSSKMLVTKTFQVTEWYAEGIGMVRSETYNKRGKMDGYTELLSYKKQ